MMFDNVLAFLAQTNMTTEVGPGTPRTPLSPRHSLMFRIHPDPAKNHSLGGHLFGGGGSQISPKGLCPAWGWERAETSGREDTESSPAGSPADDESRSDHIGSFFFFQGQLIRPMATADFAKTPAKCAANAELPVLQGRADVSELLAR